MTYRGKKQEEDENELGGSYYHEIHGRGSQHGIQDVRNTRISPRRFPGPNENDREGNEICDETTRERWDISELL